jgi:hypothetical protein
MNTKEQQQDAQRRQAMLRKKLGTQEMEKPMQFNPVLAKNALMSAEMNNRLKK